MKYRYVGWRYNCSTTLIQEPPFLGIISHRDIKIIVSDNNPFVYTVIHSKWASQPNSIDTLKFFSNNTLWCLKTAGTLVFF